MSATTNGASLEDCITNIFSLIDLNGIRWKRFKAKESQNYIYTPIYTHPVLTTYAKCIDDNLIAVWRHEPPKRNNQASQGGAGNQTGHGQHGAQPGSAGHSSFPTPTRSSNNNTPTSAGPSSLAGQQPSSGAGQPTGANSNNAASQNQQSNASSNNNNYELWIFGYGNQLKVDHVVGDDLLELEDENWEFKGLSYECRTLLFKALHNLIERCLISKGFTRLGRWFVQPLSENLNYNPPLHVAANVTANTNPPQSHHHNISSASSTTTSANSPFFNYNNSNKPFNDISGGTISSSSGTSNNNNSATTTTTTKLHLGKTDRNQSIITFPTQYNHGKNNLASTVSSAISRIIECRREMFDSLNRLDNSESLRHTSTRSSSTYFISSLDGSKSSLSFSFSFFVHGDSTICTIVDVRQHPLVHPITKTDLTTFQEGGIVRVALAPYGLNGILNGISYKDSDNGQATASFILQWSKFYPLPKSSARLVTAKGGASSGDVSNNNRASANSSAMPNTNSKNTNNEPSDAHGSRSYLSNLTNMLIPQSQKQSNMQFKYDPNEMPPVVEVIVAGYRMRYPTECVFTTSKVVDHYKSLTASLNVRSSPSGSIKRPMRSSPSKPNKLSLLSEKLSEDRTDPLIARIKTEIDTSQKVPQSPFNTPFRTSTCTEKDVSGSIKQMQKSDDCSINSGQTTNNCNSATIRTVADSEAKDKNTTEPEAGATMTNHGRTSQTTISRFNSGTKVAFNANTPLASTDLVKLFPTPPSLEQVVLSPSTMVDESTIKETTALSPFQNQQTSHDVLRNNCIDVYKPVECAVMPPPPKWAALTNIIISSSKSLPPECIYKGSSHKSTNTQSTLGKFFESTSTTTTTLTTKTNFSKSPVITRPANSLIKNSNITQSNPSPLTDQTNKSGFSNSSTNVSSPKQPNLMMTGTSTNIIPPTTPNSKNIFASSNNSPIVTIFSTFTLPHQRLFNNLHEVNSIHLNLLLSDSVLGMLKDHNFDSCTICICNMSIKGTHIDSIPQKTDTVSSWRSTIGYESSQNTSSGLGELDCSCGFSAMNNRHCSHLSGLFLEDELELTNVLYDPTEMIDQNKLFRKTRLSNYPDCSYSEEQKLIAKFISELSVKSGKNSDESMKPKQTSKDERSSRVFEETKICAIDQIRQQCSTTIHSNSSLSKVILIESFRNNRYLTSCSNYYAQVATKPTTSSSLCRFLDDSDKYLTVKMMNRNPASLKFSDFCEITKGIITKLGTQNHGSSRLASNLAKTLMPGSSGGLSSIFTRMFSPGRGSVIGSRTQDPNNRNSIFIQGLQALVMPTLSIDPKGALQMLEYLVKDESKEALATLNKAILIFSSPMHDWQFITAPIPENNLDVCNLLKILQPSLDEAVGAHDRLYKNYLHQQQQHAFSARDSPTGAPALPTPPCQGPLTWRQFHQAAGRGTEDQCEPQPIPSLLVGHHVEKNHLAVSPFALKFWDKLLLEPYAPGHNMYYMVIAPDNPSSVHHIQSFFKELSNTYELMKLGKHSPIGNGIIFAGSDTSSGDESSWFTGFESNEVEISNGVLSKLKGIASKFGPSLVKTILDFMEERQPPYDPLADRFDSSPGVSSNRAQHQHEQKSAAHTTSQSRTFNNLLGVNPAGGHQDLTGAPNNENQNAAESTAIPQSKPHSLINSIPHTGQEDLAHSDDELGKQAGIVIYIIDPFSSPSITQNLRTLSTIGLFKCYSLLTESLPENIRRITQLQLISLDSIMSHSRPVQNISRVDQLKSLSMNVYARCRKVLTNQMTAKSLTGFGPAAALDSFFKTKNPDLCVTKMFAPPFILAPLKDQQTDLENAHGPEQERSSVLFCSYCITEDQRWLLASVTDDKGELSETTVININVIDRMKNLKTSVKRVALRKLMEFIVSVMSDWMNPWRLIIGKLGRVGHGEVREWANLLSKRSLLQFSRQLNERCRQCTILPSTETVSILSACLVSLEPDSKLRIMSDQFTSDDRQASFNKCPLSTPEDASVTHILVFPTSARITSAHGFVEDSGAGLDDDLCLMNNLPIDENMEELGVVEGLFGMMDNSGLDWGPDSASVSDPVNAMMSSNSAALGAASVGDSTINQDEMGLLLQQPLALGYYISTAKIGQMPNWFWSTSPHQRHSCPVFLKSALHIHTACVQLTDDELPPPNEKSGRHQLDSSITTDVLRYVLEGYNSLSWLSLNPKTYDRQSCLPVHMQNLLQLYHLMESFS